MEHDSANTYVQNLLPAPRGISGEHPSAFLTSIERTL